MKNIKLFTLGYFLFFLLFTSVLFAQSTHDLNGTFEGVRMQYDAHHTYFTQEFQYKYDLVQEGDNIQGISTIYSEDGFFADVKIRGVVVGDKFYFEEYEIVDEIKEDYSVWCFKTGQLNIISKDGKTYLTGDTKSFMSNYGAACTGGYTEIARIDAKKPNEESRNNLSSLSDIDLNIQLAPNPTNTTATVSFELNEKEKVSIEVYDLSGKMVGSPTTQVLNAGFHSSPINVEKESTGLYIVKITVGKEVHSKELLKAAK